MIAVHTTDADYAVAIADLPVSASRSSHVSGAIVVVSGAAGWGARIRGAVEDGARAIVLRNPRSIDSDDFSLAENVAQSIPLVVERPFLRTDVSGDARAGDAPLPVLVQVECSGPRGDFESVSRDAVGWARRLLGGPLRAVTSTVTSRGLSIMLELPGGADSDHAITATVLATRRHATSTWIRAIAIGPERTEVTIDTARLNAVVELSNLAGKLVMPPLLESPQRQALRRALSAIDEGSAPSDLNELEHDWAIVSRSIQAE